MNTGKLFIISAPSAAGKTSLALQVEKTLCKHIPIEKVITFTTRAMRKGEIAGRDYIFMTPEVFDAKKNQGYFLETTVYNGNQYGSPASIKDEMKQGKSFIMATDRPGARIIKKLIPDAVLIWITVSDINLLQTRLEKRGSNPELIKQRLELAQQEIDAEKEAPLFDYQVENNDFFRAHDEIVEIVTSYSKKQKT